MRFLLIFCMIILQLMCVRVCRVLAEVPTTPKILFTSRRDGNYEIYMMNPDGSEQVNLTQHPAHDLHAAWSPTGEQILFRLGSPARVQARPVFDGCRWRECPPRLQAKNRRLGEDTLRGRPMANSLLTSA